MPPSFAPPSLSIGALSRRTGVKVPTIRFYEARGLIPDPGRTEGGQRRYGDAEAARLASSPMPGNWASTSTPLRS